MRKLLIVLNLLILMVSCVPSSLMPTATAYPTQTTTPIRISWPTKTSTPVHVYEPVTWKELNGFLASDHTNWNTYIPDKYVCVNFALDLVANANKHNINAWVVSVTFDSSQYGHAFVAFPTTDKGTVWIEPQTDYAYGTVEIGKYLCLKFDNTICQHNWGKVTKIISPAQCDAVTHDCEPE
jgi:hypothetical protein